MYTTDVSFKISLNKFKRVFALFSLLIAGLLSVACEDDPDLPAIAVTFESGSRGFGPELNALDLTLNFSRAAEQDGEITVTFVTEGMDYETDFTTDPPATGGSVTLLFSKGDESVALTMIKKLDVSFEGDESVTFGLSTLPSSYIAGTNPEVKVTMSEIVAEAGTVDINGGGPTYPNKVFIDLSNNQQVAVNRTTWDLAFYAGDEFRVVLNASNGMMAAMVDETDLNAVTDAGELEDRLSYANVFNAILGAPPAWLDESLSWIDSPDGDLSQTAIAEISATDDDNKVYIVNRGTGVGGGELGWKKIRVLRNGNGYTLQHADLDASDFETINITKNADYNFIFVSFSEGVVTVEPQKDKWDFAWTAFGNTTPVGGGLTVPYYYQDVIVQNRNGVETAMVMTADIPYNDFSEEDIDAQIFGTSQINIGNNWRSSGGQAGPPSLYTDRYFIIKDPEGNVYKVRFTALTQAGERGRPQFEFQLVRHD